ncbi:MAG: 3-hydroxyacyl-CoA dehydrogenase NAD-binding domain-containing protein [bacterium]
MSKNISLIKHKDNIAILDINLKEEKVNKLNAETLENLDQLLSEVEKDNKIKKLVIRSSKKNIFIAGADIKEIQELKTENETREKLKKANRILTKLEKIKVPTIAAIQGACLGGGLELALACDYRVASDHPKTQLGCPEVNLGIIPGFGGTQRLPEIIGLKEALKMIISGKSINIKKARKIKLIDKMINETFFEEHLMEFVKNIPTKKRKKKRKKKIEDRNPIVQNLIINLTRRNINKKTNGQYPAPIAALDVIQKSINLSFERGLKIETNAFIKLSNNQISKNLINLFFTQEKINKLYRDHPQHDKTLNSYVIGSGLMGSGIAWTLSYKGINTTIKDIEWANVSKGLNSIYNIYKSIKKRKRWKERDIQQFMYNINGDINYNGIEKNDIIIEAVFEDILLKKKLLKEVEQKNRNGIIATNTSSLSITEIGNSLQNPERLIGLHFFSPVNRMPLVEVIAGQKTSKETLEKTIQLTRRLNKTPIIVKDCPGFLINRILIPYVNEAILCLEDGAEIEEIDTLMEHFGMPLGPLRLADEVGIDIGYKVAKVLEKGYGKRMKVADSFEKIIKNRDLRGKKSKQGFYIYKNKKKKINKKIYNYVRDKKKVTKYTNIHKDCLDRLVLSMINESMKCLDEKVVETVEALDYAMILGTGYPPFRGGPCRFIDQEGVSQIIRKLEYLAKTYGERFKPSKKLIELEEKKEKLYN